MKKDTGIMLSEVRGPLKNLLDNLSGDNANYWLDALKKMLRKEELLEPPTDSQENAMKKLEGWIELLNALPTVCESSICRDGNRDLIDIEVHPNFSQFLNNDKNEDCALFSLTTNGNVKRNAISSERTDDTFNKCIKDSYKNIYEFYRALIELGKMYEENVPSPLVEKY